MYVNSGTQTLFVENHFVEWMDILSNGEIKMSILSKNRVFVTHTGMYHYDDSRDREQQSTQQYV